MNQYLITYLPNIDFKRSLPYRFAASANWSALASNLTSCGSKLSSQPKQDPALFSKVFVSPCGSYDGTTGFLKKLSFPI
jgi:hypothetical protein